MATVRLLGGRYRLVEWLGAGGMSVVWRGYDEALGRPVAIKLLTAESLAQAGSRERIWTEARATARLSHPHITGVHDYGEARTGSGPPTPYVVMELLSGSTLADRLRAGPLPVRTALQVCAQVASALAAAHGSGLVHRDVKPANVMLTPTGAKVLDFGLAAAAGAPDESRSDGQVWGTPAYLAPERLTAGRVEPASDVYALGLLLYAALTGARPWRADTVRQVLHAHRFEPPAPLPPIPALPDRVAQLCHRCLAKDPSDRPAAHQAAQVLAEAVGWRVSSVVPPRAGALPDRLAAAYTRRLGDGAGERPSVRVAAPAEVPVAVGASGTGPIGDGRPARSGGRTSAGRWRSLALAGSAAAVLGSLSAGLWLVDEPPAQLGVANPGAAGVGTAVPTAAPGPTLAGPAGGQPVSGSDPAPGDLASGGPGTGRGSAPTAGADPTAEPTAGAEPTGSPGPAASASPPPTGPPSPEPSSPAPPDSPTPDPPPADPPDSQASPEPSAAASPEPSAAASPEPSAAASRTATP